MHLKRLLVTVSSAAVAAVLVASPAGAQAPAKPNRYMMPYQWTLTGPSSNAIGLKPG